MAKNNDLPLISIITPIYNAELYLVQSIDSIINQSYPNTEIVLVNDGSTDNSQAICEEYAHKHENIKLINQVNGGVANARNTGLKHSTGKFIIHVDSDDLLLSNALKNLYDCIIEKDADIAVGNYIVKSREKKVTVAQNKCDTTKEFLHGMLSGKYHAGLWNKLIRKNFYKGVDFINGIDFMEDKLVLTNILLKNPKIGFVNKNVYVYNQVGNSYTNSISTKSLLSSYFVTTKICELVSAEFNSNFINHIKLNNKKFILLNSSSRLDNIFNEADEYIFQDKSLPLRYKILLWLDYKSFNIVIKIYKWYLKNSS